MGATCLPAAVAATAAILRRTWQPARERYLSGRSRRDCGNLEAERAYGKGQAFTSCRSRRDCGNLEAVFRGVLAFVAFSAAVAATAAILRRPASAEADKTGHGRSRRDCGNLEAEKESVCDWRRPDAAVAATAAILRREGLPLVNLNQPRPQSPRLRQS